MRPEELLRLFNDLESDRVERKESWKSSKERIREAICAFANDLPDYGLAGVVFVGVKDNGQCSNLTVDSTEKRPKTGFLHMNHSGYFGRTLEKPGFFSELNRYR